MVAAKFGTGNDVILRLVRSRGIAVGSRGRKKLLDAGQVSRLVEMHLQGMSQREIAQEFGLSQQGIGKILRRELGKIVG
jgi:transposase